jgi:O-antigen ligase
VIHSIRVDPSIRRQIGWPFCVMAAAAVVAIDPAAVAVAAGAFFLYAVWRWPKAIVPWVVFGILAVRPALDIFGERRAGVGPFAANPAVLFGLAILGAAAVVGLQRAREGKALWVDESLLRCHLWLLGAVTIAVLSGALWYGGEGAGEGVREAARVGSIVGAFLLVSWWVEEDSARFRTGWAILSAGLAAPLLVATYQFVNGSGNTETEGLNRLQGTFSHPNSFGEFLVPFVLVAISDLHSARGRRRVAQLLLAGILCAMIVLSFSRTAELALLVGFAVLPILQGHVLRKHALVRGLVLFGAFALLGWILLGTYVRQRFVDLDFSSFALDLARTGTSENSLTWRIFNWAGLISLGLVHPWVGHGAGMTTVLNPLISPVNGVPFNAHNDFVRFFFEGGLIGLACYAIYCVLLCSWVVRVAKRRGNQDPRLLGLAAGFVSLLLLTGGMAELSLNTAVQYELYGMLALSAGIWSPRLRRTLALMAR